MPSGVGAKTLVNDPRAQGIAFASDPAVFFELTEKDEYVAYTFSTPGSGSTERRSLPQTGILSRLRLVFVGVITTTLGAGTVTTTSSWPYGFLDDCKLAANAQNDLIQCDGADLHARRAIQYPGFRPNDDVDVVPGGEGAGQVLANGANTLVLSWELPVAIDPVNLVGSLYAQSPSMNLQLAVKQASDTDLLVAAGGATIDSITGTWYVMTTTFDIPLAGGDQPRLITPDLSRLHGLNAIQVPFANTGEVQAPLVRVNGQLDRLLIQVAKGDPAGNTADQYLGWTADLAEVTAVRIEYGAAKRPLNYDPAHFLAMINLDDYADSLPYGYACFDFLAENGPRDVIVMPGVTDLKAVATVGSGVAVAAGARVRLFAETLFA